MSQPGNVATACGVVFAVGPQLVAASGDGRNAISPIEAAKGPLAVRTVILRETSPAPVTGETTVEPDVNVAASKRAGSTMVKSQLARLAVTTQQPSGLAAMASGSFPEGSMP